MKSKLRLLLASLLTAAFGGTAFAQLDNFYAEGLVGISSIKVATGKFTNNTFTQQLDTATPATAPNSITVTGKDKSSQAFGLRVGYQLSPIFSVEGTYINVGTASVTGTGVMVAPTASASAVAFKTDLDITSWNFGFAARHTMDNFSLVGRLGISTSTAEWGKTISNTTAPTAGAQSASKFLLDAFPAQQRKVDFNYGLGVSYKVNDHVSVSGNYDYVSGAQAANVISASLKYAF